VSRGYKVKTQKKCGPFRIDLAIGNVAIECDGKAYHSSTSQRAYDRRRTSYIRRRGYKSVLRFSGSEINKNVWSCVDRIEKKLKE
jgi:very-short-patch-repair endonuclease